MALHLPTPRHRADVYWALVDTLRPAGPLRTETVISELVRVNYDAVAVLEAALKLGLLRHADSEGSLLLFGERQLHSAPRPAFYSTFQPMLSFPDRAGRPHARDEDPLTGFGEPAAPTNPAASPWAQRPVAYHPLAGNLDVVLPKTLPEVHARLLNPPAHLRALAEVLAHCPPASYPHYEALQDVVVFGQLHTGEPGPPQASGLLVLQFTLGDFVRWDSAWHALLDDEYLDPVLLLLFTQPSNRDLTAVLEVPAGMTPEQARRSFAKYFRQVGYAPCFRDVAVLDGNHGVYVVNDEWAYLRSDLRVVPKSGHEAAPFLGGADTAGVK